MNVEPGGRSAFSWRLGLARVGLVLFSLILGLVAAEMLLRGFELAPEVSLVREGRFQLSPNPKLGYEPVPHFEYQGGLDSFHDFQGRSNSLGMRDREHDLTKPLGTTRVLVLGDSVAAGQKVLEREQIFPAQLEAGLRATGRAIEVINLAVSGYNTGQEVEMLRERGLAFSPDLVMLAYCLNDTRLDDGGILSGLLARQPGQRATARIHPQLARSALYRLLWHRLTAVDPKPAIAGDSVSSAFDELGRLSLEHGFRVLVVVFPRFGGGPYAYHEEHVLPEAASRRNGFAYFDLLSAFEACRATTDRRLARDRYHPTAAGHACAATAVQRFLESRPDLLEPLRR